MVWKINEGPIKRWGLFLVTNFPRPMVILGLVPRIHIFQLLEDDRDKHDHDGGEGSDLISKQEPSADRAFFV